MVKTEFSPSEQVLIDLIRIGITEDAAAMRQLCRRILRRPPTDLQHPGAVKAALAELIAKAPLSSSGGLRHTKEVIDQGPPVLDSRDQSEPLLRRSFFAVPIEPVLDSVTSAHIETLIKEHSDPSALVSFGLTPSRAVSFTGPPGVGKTLTASYIASRLELPLVTLDIGNLMSSLMGRTGKNLQAALQEARQQPSVLFLDEFDAIAKSRGDDSDVGEAKRIVTVLLQGLDSWPAGSFLIAATNHPEMIDSAVMRRFDSTIHFPRPDLQTRARFIRLSRIAQTAHLDDSDIHFAAMATAGMSHSDLERWLQQVTRRTLVDTAANHVDSVRAALQQATLARLVDASNGTTEVRRAAAHYAHDQLGLSQREIGERLGVSHVTIGKDLNRMS